MGSSEKGPRPAYVVDVDDSGKRVPGSRRSAKKSTKERPQVSQRESARSDKPRRHDADPQQAAERAVTGSGARKQEVVTAVKEERRKSSSSSTHSPRKERPPSAHKNQSFPKLQIGRTSKRDDPTHFGQQTPASATRPTPPTIVSQPSHMTQPIPMRPRAVTAQTYPPRPVSYHAAYGAGGGYGPPLSSSAWANYQPAHQPIITPSYPPPSPGYIRYAATPAPPTSDYFGSQAMSAPERPMSARPLSSRFGTPARPSSGIGMYDAHQQELADAYSAGYHDDGYTSASDGVARKRESIRVPSRVGQRLSKNEADYQAMPPPPRPILRRPLTDYPTEPIDPYHEGRTLIRDDSRPRRPSSHRNSVSYDLGDGPERVHLETANNGRRRQSYYGQSAQSASTGSSAYEDKIRQASTYQQDVGETVPLTAEVLKRQQRRQAGGSSRSTKSSASRDESDWRKSATTRTTRSGSGEGENVTIKVTGTARVMVGGAQIDCPDGGEIEIKQQQKALRNGSEQSSEYGGPERIEDRRSRDTRTSGKSRMSSRPSYTRSQPKQYYEQSRESRDTGWF
ncbi:hypothetical protein LSUE1_G008617 [Lachnellula suecica]|uniref:Uncharacterized protein n=1 Tax=Lachnellula suecica TaxID=602035 RepID=A0A8T9BYP5_9HELO|nr:hypothetical protein LSUE1_G008617 [Lachnellula suecica]